MRWFIICLSLLLVYCQEEEPAPDSECGNNKVEAGEICDDGTTTWRCTSECTTRLLVAAGSKHTCGLRKNGTIECWGQNLDGETTPPTTKLFAGLDGGDRHTCGVGLDSSVECWGLAHYGYGKSKPPDGIYNQVACGKNFSCAIQSIGALACWGDNQWSQATPPAKTVSASEGVPPEEVLSLITLGTYHACGITTSGSVICWGAGETVGECGGDKYQCGQAAPQTGTYTDISAGALHTCAITQSESIECWGINDLQQSSPPSGNFTAVACGKDHSCAISKSDGEVQCWGDNTFGQKDAPSGGFVQIDAGGHHTCGIQSGEIVKCWGAGEEGEGGAHDKGQATPPNSFPSEG